ncbi:DJ-1/PfpI family protein [Pseudomonas vlassakiae]|uniref:DJ-1/PfpI family protein n=1 Tax=Pseudomonas vlassakiae TaxID=485888 RepID=UPI0021C689A4|nr:DJ-1/PfpI family protein [Pseudomonas vlassakiae]MCU0122927.1 DJ-1/PfpI family protein [Pseudomonas vlassakiae]
MVGPADVFAEAAKQLGNPRAYRVEVTGTEKGMIKGSSGLKLAIDETFETYKGRIDTLLVAGGPQIDEIDEIVLNPALQQWLRTHAMKVRRIGSVCSGAFLLAAAGLLDGRRVTTHWNSSAKLAKEHPQTEVDADSILSRTATFTRRLVSPRVWT